MHMYTVLSAKKLKFYSEMPHFCKFELFLDEYSKP